MKERPSRQPDSVPNLELVIQERQQALPMASTIRGRQLNPNRDAVLVKFFNCACDREPPQAQEINRRKSPDPSLQCPRGMNEGITLVRVKECTDVKERKEKADQEQDKGEDADSSRSEVRQGDEGRNQRNGDDEEKTPQTGVTKETSPRNRGVEGEEQTEAENCRRSEGGTWLVQVHDCCCVQITPV
ncbi:hypothetical protein NDU88_007460 [Pleurodeles waltl]|uniref:Uncharacterized protein n=1 Tax=Pleurodeles waltl TaxID=8319 RepID=A0AAV7QS02_PLEWA|nr:hypothetical protein NDU88_007460 [Pleurodeles waltl]